MFFVVLLIKYTKMEVSNPMGKIKREICTFDQIAYGNVSPPSDFSLLGDFPPPDFPPPDFSPGDFSPPTMAEFDRPPILLEEEMNEEREACTLEDYCSFYTFSVVEPVSADAASKGETNEWSCGSDRYGGAECHDVCCEAQNGYCRGGGFLGFGGNATMRGYFTCMRQRGCNKRFSCEGDDNSTKGMQLTKNIQFGDSKELNYDVPPDPSWDDMSDRDDLCHQYHQGGVKCGTECCSKQHEWCKTSNANLKGYNLCMIERNCQKEAKLDVSETEEQLEGCNLPNSKWANPFNVPCFGEKCEKKCATWWQGGDGCEKECCLLQHSHCRGSNAINGMEGYFKCLRMRGCGDVMSCDTDGSKSEYYASDDYDFTYNITPNHAEDKCGTGRQGGSTCVDTCCSEQHQYCRDSNGHLRGYMQCMDERGCDGPAVKHTHGGTTQDESDQCNLIGHSNGNAWGNPFDVPCFGNTCDKKCETSWYQGKMACAKQCCKVQHNYCRANSFREIFFSS